MRKLKKKSLLHTDYGQYLVVNTLLFHLCKSLITLFCDPKNNDRLKTFFPPLYAPNLLFLSGTSWDRDRGRKRKGKEVKKKV